MSRMTFRELLAVEHPNARALLHCPSSYGYEPEDAERNCSATTCRACWNREVPEELVSASRPVVFISGPITGVPDYKKAFDKAADALRRAGYIPLSPAVLPQGMTYEQYMRICFAMIDSAAAVLFLPGASKSKGSRVELAYCRYIGKPWSTDPLHLFDGEDYEV